MGARDTHCELIEMAECGAISWETIARECMHRMSADEVDDMARECDWIDDDDEEEDDEEEFDDDYDDNEEDNDDDDDV